MRSALIVLFAVAGTADAQPNFRLRSLPPPYPTSLAIRAQSPAPAPPASGPDQSTAQAAGPDNPFELAPDLRRELSESDVVGQQRSLSDRVVFRFNIGYGLDGGRGSEQGRLLSGHNIGENQVGYEPLRRYAFGDAVIGTRGYVVESLSLYFASAFRFDQFVGSPNVSAVPSTQDNDIVDDVRVRSAYAEAQQFASTSWLRPLYLKAGRMFEYGPAVAHFTGVNVGYNSETIKVALYGGPRTSMWGFDHSDNQVDDNGNIAGAELVVDLYARRKWPAVVTFHAMEFDDSSHFEIGGAYQYNPDILLRASVRTIDGDAARQNLTLRARVSDVSTVFAEVDNRSRADWMYDILYVQQNFAPTDPRLYLNLGIPLPRTMFRVRAGTVLLDAVDVLLSGAVAIERSDEDDVPSTFSPTYFEGGAALDVRVRRAIRVGASFDGRRYRRDEIILPDVGGIEDPLFVDTSVLGERGYIQMGTRIKYSTGARGFNAEAEFYGRVYDAQSPYIAIEDIEVDTRLGGRFGIESWVAQRLRLKGVYDVSGTIEEAPELTGLKSLRVIMEGTF